MGDLYLARNKTVHFQMTIYGIGGGCSKTCEKQLLRLVGEEFILIHLHSRIIAYVGDLSCDCAAGMPHLLQNQNVIKYLQKQTNCSVLTDFHNATFAHSGPNSGFSRDFFAQNGASVQDFVSVFYFLDGLTRNFGAGKRNSEPRNSFFGARNFYFGARMEKSRYRNFFAAASGPFFFPGGNFYQTRFPCRFVGGIPLWTFPPVGFLRRECPVSRQKDRFGGDSATF